MVSVKTTHLELPRRVAIYYLLFCLSAVIWLMVGVAFVASDAIQSRSENALHATLTQEAARFEIDFIRNGPDNFQSLVEQVCDDSLITYCALVSPDRHFLAHSDPKMAGQLRAEPVGTRHIDGQITSIQFTNDGGRRLREFQIPLKSDAGEFGKLLVAAKQPNAFEMILTAGKMLPIAVVGPIAILVFGGFYLQRMVRPMADIDSQLRRIAVAPIAQTLTIQKVAVAGPGSVGWNRLANEVNTSVQRPDLEERLGIAIASRDEHESHEMLNAIPEGLATSTATGQITYANQAFLTFAGLATRDALKPEDRAEELLNLLEAAPDNPLLDPKTQGRRIVTEVVRQDTSRTSFTRLARYPIRSPDSPAILGHVWSVRDITQQRLSDKMRDEFLDSAAHELRTPLANIKAYAETLTLTDMIEVEQQKEFCNTINTEATRLARMIDDLLNVSSMEAGSLAISRTRVEVDRLLRDVATKVQAQMDQAEITFETHFSEKLPALRLDKDKIATTLINLLGNAAKYTPQGGRVAIKARVVNSSLEIDIEDSGYGISPEELPKVFEKFFRSNDDRVRNITGTGLGLSLAHEIVRLHGGSLTVQSELNKGSTFKVTLPLEQG